MERLTLSNNEIHTDAGIWILKNGNIVFLTPEEAEAALEECEEKGIWKI